MNIRHPLIHRIQKIEEQHKTGSLFVHHEDNTIEIYFLNGLINTVSSSSETDRLGQFLLREGYIGYPELRELLHRASKEQSSVGEAALQLNVLAPSQLSGVIQQQAFHLLKKSLQNGWQIQSFRASSGRLSFPVQISLKDLFLELARSSSGDRAGTRAESSREGSG
ncbi:MAG: DUF4388 domain-containing protein [Acidobacteriota bacterium]